MRLACSNFEASAVLRRVHLLVQSHLIALVLTQLVVELSVYSDQSLGWDVEAERWEARGVSSRKATKATHITSAELKTSLSPEVRNTAK